jgi:hypothetical protein
VNRRIGWLLRLLRLNFDILFNFSLVRRDIWWGADAPPSRMSLRAESKVNRYLELSEASSSCRALLYLKENCLDYE